MFFFFFFCLVTINLISETKALKNYLPSSIFYIFFNIIQRWQSTSKENKKCIKLSLFFFQILTASDLCGGIPEEGSVVSDLSEPGINPVELMVSNLDYNISAREWKKILFTEFQQQVQVGLV